MKKAEEIALEYKKVNDKVKDLRGKLSGLELKEDLSEDDLQRLKQLQVMMGKIEGLKKKEAEFKVKCKLQKAKIEDRNQGLKQEISNQEEVENNELLEKELAKKRLELASLSVKVTGLERQLDQVPSANELQQYQRRFFELDDQMSAEYSSTQQHVTLFNTLEDQKVFTSKAIGLYETILDTVPDPRLFSAPVKIQFAEKVHLLKMQVDQSLTSYENKLMEDEKKRMAVQEKVNKLLEEQRTYALLVDLDLRDEMRKNQLLMSRI